MFILHPIQQYINLDYETWWCEEHTTLHQVKYITIYEAWGDAFTHNIGSFVHKL